MIRLPDELLHLDLPGHQPVLELGDGAHTPHHLPVLSARHTAAETLRSKISLFMKINLKVNISDITGTVIWS